MRECDPVEHHSALQCSDLQSSRMQGSMNVELKYVEHK